MARKAIEERAPFEHALDLARANPPQIHQKSSKGVFSASTGCLRFIGDALEERGRGAVTIETGLGVSTVLFAASGAHHTSVFLSSPSRPEEGETFLEWCQENGIDVSRLELVDEPSQMALPRVSAAKEYDLVFIDGCHGYPAPQIDWFYACSGLKDGGIVVVDDIQLRAPWDLAEFLAADPRWEPLARYPRWAAFRRHGMWNLAEDWGSQPFFTVPRRRDPVTTLKNVIPRRVKRSLRRLTGRGSGRGR